MPGSTPRPPAPLSPSPPNPDNKIVGDRKGRGGHSPPGPVIGQPVYGEYLRDIVLLNTASRY
eukprot:6161922-Pleurochrysis_carterae.AAC.1